MRCLVASDEKCLELGGDDSAKKRGYNPIEFSSLSAATAADTERYFRKKRGRRMNMESS